MSDVRQELYLIADEMRGMATAGKHFAGNVYEVERAERIMELAAKVAALADGGTPAEVHAVFSRELWEEAGLRGRVDRLLAVFDSRHWGSRSKVHHWHMAFLVECADTTAVPGSEMLAAKYFDPDHLPDVRQRGHERRIPTCVAIARGGEVFFDPGASYDAVMPMHQRPDGHERAVGRPASET